MERGIEIAIKYAGDYLANGRSDQVIGALQYVQKLQETPVVSRGLIQRYENLAIRIPSIEPITMSVAPPRTIKLQYPPLRGEDVRSLQRALSIHGIEVDVDGIFGKDSERALKEFQRNAGLPVTGKTDAETRSRLGID